MIGIVKLSSTTLAFLSTNESRFLDGSNATVDTGHTGSIAKPLHTTPAIRSTSMSPPAFRVGHVGVRSRVVPIACIPWFRPLLTSRHRTYDPIRPIPFQSKTDTSSHLSSHPPVAPSHTPLRSEWILFGRSQRSASPRPSSPNAAGRPGPWPHIGGSELGRKALGKNDRQDPKNITGNASTLPEHRGTSLVGLLQLPKSCNGRNGRRLGRFASPKSCNP